MEGNERFARAAKAPQYSQATTMTVCRSPWPLLIGFGDPIQVRQRRRLEGSVAGCAIRNSNRAPSFVAVVFWTCDKAPRRREPMDTQIFCFWAQVSENFLPDNLESDLTSQRLLCSPH